MEGSHGAVAATLLPACPGARHSLTFSYVLSLMRSDCLKDKGEVFHKADSKSTQANTDFTVMLGLAKKFLKALPHHLM